MTNYDTDLAIVSQTIKGFMDEYNMTLEQVIIEFAKEMMIINKRFN